MADEEVCNHWKNNEQLSWSAANYGDVFSVPESTFHHVLHSNLY